jgi:hypothetical protein
MRNSEIDSVVPLYAREFVTCGRSFVVPNTEEDNINLYVLVQCDLRAYDRKWSRRTLVEDAEQLHTLLGRLAYRIIVPVAGFQSARFLKNIIQT